MSSTKEVQMQGFNDTLHPEVEAITGVNWREWETVSPSIVIPSLVNVDEVRKVGEGFYLVTVLVSSGTWYNHYLFHSYAQLEAWSLERFKRFNSIDIEAKNMDRSFNRV